MASFLSTSPAPLAPTLTTSIKLVYAPSGETRRISTATFGSFAELSALVQCLWGAGPSYVLTFCDEDGDAVWVTSDSELDEAFVVARDMGVKVLKFTVYPDRVAACLDMNARKAAAASNSEKLTDEPCRKPLEAATADAERSAAAKATEAEAKGEAGLKKPPHSVVVSDCVGNAQVLNGVYSVIGTYRGQPHYSKNGLPYTQPADGFRENLQIWFNQGEWRIGISNDYWFTTSEATPLSGSWTARNSRGAPTTIQVKEDEASKTPDKADSETQGDTSGDVKDKGGSSKHLLEKLVKNVKAHPLAQLLVALGSQTDISGGGGDRAHTGSKVVHPGITCDRSGMSPIVGPRFHVLGNNFDLCEAEFEKLPEAERCLFVRIDTPGASPIPCLPVDQEIVGFAVDEMDRKEDPVTDSKDNKAAAEEEEEEAAPAVKTKKLTKKKRVEENMKAQGKAKSEKKAKTKAMMTEKELKVAGAKAKNTEAKVALATKQALKQDAAARAKAMVTEEVTVEDVSDEDDGELVSKSELSSRSSSTQLIIEEMVEAPDEKDAPEKGAKAEASSAHEYALTGLAAMGFYDRDENLALLTKFDGQINRVLNSLLDTA